MYTVAVVLLTFLLTQGSCQRVWVMTRKLPSVNKAEGLTITSDLAVDGKEETNFLLGSCFSSAAGDLTPVWYVDMGRAYHVHSVDILNRGDCCGDQLSNIIIDVTDNDPITSTVEEESHCGMITEGIPSETHINTVCLYHLVKTKFWYKAMFPRGRYVKIQKGGESLTLCEVKVTVVSETRNRNPIGRKRSAETDIYVLDVPEPIRIA